MLQYQQFRSGMAIARLLENLVVRLRSFRLSNSFLSISLEHTIKWNALAEVSSAISINEMGHATIRYNTTLSFQGKIPWLPSTHIAKSTNNHKKASVLQIWRVNHRFLFSVFDERDFITKRVLLNVLCLSFTLLILNKPKIKIDIRFPNHRYKCNKEQVLCGDDTNIENNWLTF